MKDFLLEQDNSTGKESRREFSELMQDLAGELSEADRSLVRLVYGNGAKPSAIAAACGVKGTSLYSRLRRIENRIKDPVAVTIWRVRESIPPDARTILVRHIIGGVNVSQLAEEHGHPKKWVYDTIERYRRFATGMANDAAKQPQRQKSRAKKK